VNNLTSYVKPDAKFIPPHELKPDDKMLKGFNWRVKDKPLRQDVVKTETASVTQQKKAAQ
jgi:hypothetical protein